MVFNSLSFIIFFILFFLIYWHINNKYSVNTRNLFILISSYIFYGWWDWRFLSLLFISSLIDYTIGLLINRTEIQFQRKLLLIISLIVNLSLLGFFKYYNFFIDSLRNSLAFLSLEINTSTLGIILPVGISFYTFQTLSYSIDVYRRKIMPTKNAIDFFAFVTFFPQLVAGPIERASNLLPQFRDRKIFDYNNCIVGLRQILWGFFKKIVIADNMGILADSIFNSEGQLSGLSVIFGAVFFAIQIYGDFSGYSDIAIGTSKMLGFNLMNNFSTPYFANSFEDFWRRWHISLSTWFKDYVYIPLGGNKKSSFRTYSNIFITFLLSGLWHGANITFVIWGALHGTMLVIEKIIIQKIESRKTFSKMYSILAIMMVILFWIPFRAKDFSQLKELTTSLFSINKYSFNYVLQVINDFSNLKFWAILVILSIFFWTEFSFNKNDFNRWITSKQKPLRFIIYYLIIISIVLLGNYNIKPNFIYFQF